MGKKIDEKLREQLIEMYKQGMTIADIARTVNKKEDALSGWFRHNGFSKKEDKKILQRKICEEYKDGLTTKELAEKYNYSYKNILVILHNHNIEIVEARGFATHSKESYAEMSKKTGKDKNYRWKGGRFKNKFGYIVISNPLYEYGNGEKQRVLEHRYFMEQHLGRKLTLNEHVHHINGIKDDNRLENLVIKKSIEHYGEVVCPNCQCQFRVR